MHHGFLCSAFTVWISFHGAHGHYSRYSMYSTLTVQPQYYSTVYDSLTVTPQMTVVLLHARVNYSICTGSCRQLLCILHSIADNISQQQKQATHKTFQHAVSQQHQLTQPHANMSCRPTMRPKHRSEPNTVTGQYEGIFRNPYRYRTVIDTRYKLVQVAGKTLPHVQGEHL